MKISGAVAIVTGGASGLGKATAELLAQKGAQVAILDLDGPRFAQACRGAMVAQPCDVSDPTSVRTAFNTIVAKLGAPRIVVNCAGIATSSRLVGRDGPLSLTNFQRVVSVNLFGTFNVMTIAAAAMIELDSLETGERGVIVNTASIAAFEGQIGQAAYAASKGGVASLTLPAAREFARIGIRVVAIAPGLFGTPMVLGMPIEVQQAITANVPFPPRFGEPTEYAAFAAHIVENPMLNGATLRIDAALRMQPR